MDHDAELAMVRRHVAMGERSVSEQRQRVEDCRKTGRPSDMAESLLTEFETLQALHVAHLNRLLVRDD